MAPQIRVDQQVPGTYHAEKPQRTLTALPYTALGSITRDVLYGSRGTGVFTPDQKLAFSTRTASGVALTGTAIRQGDRVMASVTGSQTLAALNGSMLTAMATSGGVVGLDLTTKVTHGLTTITSASIAPGPLSSKAISSKLGFEYTNDYVHVKGSTSAEQQPVVNVALATGYGNLQLGADLTYSTARALESARSARDRATRIIREDHATGNTPISSTTGPKASGGSGSSPSPTQYQSGAGKVQPAAEQVYQGAQTLNEQAFKGSAYSAAGLVGGLTQWTAALGWQHEVHQVALTVSDPGTQPLVLATKLSYAMTVQDGITVAAEALRDLPLQTKSTESPYPVSFSVGVAANVWALQKAADNGWSSDGQTGSINNSNSGLIRPANGNSPLVKVKLDSSGTVSALYSDRLLNRDQVAGMPSLQVTWTAQVNAQDPFARMPRIGMAAELV